MNPTVTLLTVLADTGAGATTNLLARTRSHAPRAKRRAQRYYTGDLVNQTNIHDRARDVVNNACGYSGCGETKTC